MADNNLTDISSPDDIQGYYLQHGVAPGVDVDESDPGTTDPSRAIDWLARRWWDWRRQQQEDLHNKLMANPAGVGLDVGSNFTGGSMGMVGSLGDAEKMFTAALKAGHTAEDAAILANKVKDYSLGSDTTNKPALQGSTLPTKFIMELVHGKSPDEAFATAEKAHPKDLSYFKSPYHPETPNTSWGATPAAPPVHTTAPVDHDPFSVMNPSEPTLDIKDMIRVGDKPGGSIPGGIYAEPHGDTWLVKQVSDTDRARNEVLAGKLYQAAGVRVPDLEIVKGPNGEHWVASKMIPGFTENPQHLIDQYNSHSNGVFDGYAADSWLGNWDNVGLYFDNLGFDPEGNAIRIDLGGALRYRSMGEPKGEKFGNTVGELDSIKAAQNGSKVFGGITPEQIAPGAQRIAQIDPAKIRQLVREYGPLDAVENKKLQDTLLARQQDLVKKTGVQPSTMGLQSESDILKNANIKGMSYPDAFNHLIEQGISPESAHDFLTGYLGKYKTSGAETGVPPSGPPKVTNIITRPDIGAPFSQHELPARAQEMNERSWRIARGERLSDDEFNEWYNSVGRYMSALDLPMSDEELKAISHYQGGSSEINHLFRSRDPHSGQIVRGYARALNDLIMHSPLPTDLLVHRGVNTAEYSPEALRPLFQAPPRPGDIIGSQGFTSTTLRPNITDSFMSGPEDKRYMFSIALPKGSPALPVYTGEPGSLLDLERELLLPPGQKFRVRGVDTYKVPDETYNPGQQPPYHVALEAIPHGTSPTVGQTLRQGRGLYNTINENRSPFKSKDEGHKYTPHDVYAYLASLAGLAGAGAAAFIPVDHNPFAGSE